MLGGLIVETGDRLFRPVNTALMKAEAKPFAMNVAELAAAAACGVCFARRQLLPAVSLLLIHGMFDYLDGGIRRSIQKSGENVRSTVFTHVAVDKISDMLLFLSLGWGRFVPWWLGIAACISTVAVSLCGLWGERRRGLQLSYCLFDRSDKIIVLLLLSPFSLLKLGVFASVAMNATVIAQRCRRMAAGKRLSRA